MRNFFNKYGYFVFPTAVLLVILAVKNADGISSSTGYYLMHYLYNYSHGFMTRGFVGQVISMFTDTVTPNIMSAVQFSFSVLLLIASSVCFGVALKKNHYDRKIYDITVLLVLFLLLYPQSFLLYFDSYMTDKLLIALTLIAVLLAGRKYFRWLVPVLCLICTLINIIYSAYCMIFIAIVLLQNFYDSRKRAKNAILCVLSYGSIIAVSCYGLLAMHNLSFGSPEEMFSYYMNRYSDSSALNLDWFVNEIFLEYFKPLSAAIDYSLTNFLPSSFWSLITGSLFHYLPLFAAIGYFWCLSAKEAKNKFQKFIFVLCMISPILAVFPSFMSFEFFRFFSVNIQMQLCICIYYLAKRNDAVTSAATRVYDYFSVNRLPFYLSAAYLMIAVGTI